MVPATGAPLVGPGTTVGWDLAPAAPEPARGPQHFRLSVARPVRLDVRVHDVTGRVVRHLPAGPRTAGTADLVWDGRDDAGRPVASGVYFLRADDGTRRITRRATRLR
jgi:flagellar hook assembly protein FlgD